MRDGWLRFNPAERPDPDTPEGVDVLREHARSAKLLPCTMCGRKSTLKVWIVFPRFHEQRWDGGTYVDDEGWTVLARAICLDSKDCYATIHRRNVKAEEARERRRPRMPHYHAPPGCCKFCGEAIEFDETKKGWKRRRQRGYHRQDEWELPLKQRPHPELSCDQLASYWMTPKAASRYLLKKQAGRCAICDREIGELVSQEFEWDWSRTSAGEHVSRPERLYYTEIPLQDPKTHLEVDHREAIADGGTNRLENLQLICHKPCHTTKTGREARERAKRRRAIEETAQLALAS